MLQMIPSTLSATALSASISSNDAYNGTPPGLPPPYWWERVARASMPGMNVEDGDALPSTMAAISTSGWWSRLGRCHPCAHPPTPTTAIRALVEKRRAAWGEHPRTRIEIMLTLSVSS